MALLLSWQGLYLTLEVCLAVTFCLAFCRRGIAVRAKVKDLLWRTALAHRDPGTFGGTVIARWQIEAQV